MRVQAETESVQSHPARWHNRAQVRRIARFFGYLSVKLRTVLDYTLGDTGVCVSDVKPVLLDIV